MTSRPPSLRSPTDANWFRQVLGHYPTGVCVVTAMGPTGPAGMSVGSFTSVSLDPPLIAFLPDKRSTSWPKIRPAPRFCVNVLSEEQEEVCRAFATPGIDKFAAVEWGRSAGGVPHISGATAWIECALETVHEAGDHYIVIGRVLELDVPSPSLPLLFFRGGYGRFRPSSMVSGESTLITHLRKADAARSCMERLSAEGGLECTASVLVGTDVVVIASAGRPRSGISTRVGQRLAFVPPVGSLFVAWADEAAVGRWMDRSRPKLDPADRAAYEEGLKHVRARGWTVSLGSVGARLLDDALDDDRASASAPDVSRAARQVVFNPPEIRSDVLYDPASLSAPVFDAHAGVSMTITLSGFVAPQTGAEVESCARTLAEAARHITAATGGLTPAATMV